ACVLRGDETRDDGGERDAGPSTGDAGCPVASCPVDFDWSRWSTPDVTPPASAYAVTAGVVTDSVTGLTWQRGAALSNDGGVLAFPFVAAVQYCDGLTIDGSTGWRLPTVVELVSIVSYGASSPAVNVVTFPQTVGQLYWSATGATGAPATGWVVNFGSGATSAVTLSSACRVRCVK
ncbi:MAG: DUF1566 domain-containing protein, partial [Archangium sp.]|nr:DUF1566 domain-containing protein [Archangium sp.]